MFEFKRLSPDDFHQLLDWLSRKHVKQWWNDGDDTLEKVAAHYGAADETRRFILLRDKKPIGYFQYYFDGDAIGIDQFIGEETLLDLGIGQLTIKMFVHLIAEKHNPAFIFLDPSPENKRAIRCYEKVGFRHYETVFDKDGAAAYMMKIEI